MLRNVTLQKIIKRIENGQISDFFVFLTNKSRSFSAQIFGFAFATKTSFLGAIISWLRAAQGAVVSKVIQTTVNDESLTPEERQRRAAGFESISDLIEMADKVYKAIEKFE